jgi:Ca-activated chloride channel homolog
MQFGFTNRLLRHIVIALMMIGSILNGANAQSSVDVSLRVEFGNASQIIIPQSRGFVVNPRSPVEQRGQAIMIDSVEARVKILEQTASTSLEIRLRNPAPQQTEAIVLLPVPEGAVVSAFTFEGAASEPTAQVLRKDEARRLYDSIVAQVRDPALLEFAGYNLIRSSVFPVPGGGTQRVRLTYEHLLPADGQRVDYLLPRSESLDRRSPWNIAVDVQSKSPISTAYSPGHEIVTTRLSPRHLAIKIAEQSKLDPGPFMLSYLVEHDGVSASMFAYPDLKIGEDGGYFLLMAGLPASIGDQPNPIKRELTLVIDRSGSMAGPKMDQAKAAALQVLEGLADGESFNIIDYSTTVSSFAPRPVTKDKQQRAEARKYIEAIKPGGGTNIHDALTEALRAEPAAGVLPIVLFLTDGLPTVGQTSEVAIRELAEKGNPHHRRIFTFGVGNDVNVPLLDKIADLTRATTTYVLPEEDVEVKVAAVFKRLYGPVFKDIQLRTAGNVPSTRLVRELIPSPIPDLFDGDQLILLGQYQHDGPIVFTVSGEYLGQRREFTFRFDLNGGATTKNAFVPRLWASRRIAYLVDQIRQAGAVSGLPTAANVSPLNDPRFKELSDEILRLSTEFGILTEYTAFLATEGTNLSDWNTLSAGCSWNLDNRAVKARTGAAAVNQGINFNAQKGQQHLNAATSNSYVDSTLNRVEVANVQQMCDRAFLKRGTQWIDTRLVSTQEQQEAQITPDLVVVYGSPEHLALLQKLVTQNRQGVLSLDGDILIQDEGKNILIKNGAPTP